MQIRKPAYFDSFRCIAGQCPDSCCKDWEVEVDDKSATFYRSLPGPLGDRLRAVLKDDPEWGTVMTIENSRCPMWREDGLCRIQAELNHDALCQTCRDFPRISHDYGTFRELGLELSCPEAARLIMNASDAPFITEDVPGGEAPDYDEDAMYILLQTREEALSILNHPDYSVTEALVLLLYYGYQAQAQLDGEEPADFSPALLLQEAKFMGIPDTEQDLVNFFKTLEILNPQWLVRLSSPIVFTNWASELRNLARYFIERYWLQAVSDYDLVSRVKLAIISCIVVHLLGGDVVQTAQMYSKEIENSPENMDALFDALYSHPAMTDHRILGMLIP